MTATNQDPDLLIRNTSINQTQIDYMLSASSVRPIREQ